MSAGCAIAMAMAGMMDNSSTAQQMASSDQTSSNFMSGLNQTLSQFNGDTAAKAYQIMLYTGLATMSDALLDPDFQGDVKAFQSDMNQLNSDNAKFCPEYTKDGSDYGLFGQSLSQQLNVFGATLQQINGVGQNFNTAINSELNTIISNSKS